MNSGLHGTKRFIEVFENVIDVLDSDRDTDQLRCNARIMLFPSPRAADVSSMKMNDEGLCVPNVGEQTRKLDVVDKCFSASTPPLIRTQQSNQTSRPANIFLRSHGRDDLEVPDMKTHSTCGCRSNHCATFSAFSL